MEKPVNHKATEPELFVFDICDTLFYSNTTFDFIKFVLQKKGWGGKLRQFDLYTKRTSPVFIGLYFFQKFSKEDWPKKLCLRLLKGVSKKELYQLGEAFEKQFLASRMVEKTHQMLRQLRKEGKTVVLISASIDPVVAAIANALAVDYRCSELAYDSQGNFTGDLQWEMTGQKLVALRKMLSSEDAPFAVATDNFSDRGLVEAACHRFVVVYNEKALNFWQDLQPEFIKLYS
ncbi:HAD family hydrolase [Adhaeribacter soli]|uniref:HAD-IB family phosphatase n=1 Tax=Adhaeribacter soli TaxID=2607655 RepID=A0A5N1IL17_9BACT|nr:HAD-IB family phosphatase [Adhaeribacter soli]KAA9327381.1 HAD-IB family phosphatase [Adhaeribacter soli]